jgi:hypothetical protein
VTRDHHRRSDDGVHEQKIDGEDGSEKVEEEGEEGGDGGGDDWRTACRRCF